jgi:hypothetical protein
MTVNYCQFRQLKWHLFKSRLNMLLNKAANKQNANDIYLSVKYGDKTHKSSYFLCKVPFTSKALFTRSWPTLMAISLKGIGSIHCFF